VDLLEDLASTKPQEYAEFWKTFGVVLKKGIIDEPAQKTRIAKLLRFNSTADSGDAPNATLEAYVSRMKADQKSIYYLTADSLAAARKQSALEAFAPRNEVLLLTDRVDEWVAAHLHEFEGKTLANVASRRGRRGLGDRGPPTRPRRRPPSRTRLERLAKNLTARLRVRKCPPGSPNRPPFWSPANSA